MNDVVETLNRGRVARGRHAADGNAALLVLVDSRGPYHNRRIVDETVLLALEHYGFPYRLLDLAQARPTADRLAGCAALVIAQDGAAGDLSEAESRLVAEAVSRGMGLVNLDWDLRRCRGPLLEIFGFEGVERLPIASDLFLVPANEHDITRLHEPRAFHQSARMVTALVVGRWGRQTEPLVEAVLGKEQLVYIRHLVPGNAFEPRHYPVVFAAGWGEGRAVQYAVNPRLWRKSALGHLGGMGDLFWRSIVWATRKPFVANMIPPYVTMSFDDCTGHHDFRYLDICTDHGFKPMASLFIDTIGEAHRPRLQTKAAAGEILVNTHALDYYRLAYYDYGVEPYSPEVLQQIFERQDQFFRWLGAEPCRTIRSHWGEHAVDALAHHKERGQTLMCLPVHIGEHKADQSYTDPGEGYWPYDTVRCFYDHVPDDPDIFIFGSFNVRHLVDFLTGATVILHESDYNDVKRAAAQAATSLKRGLENGFYGELVTHEQKIGMLSLDEWDQILGRALSDLDRFEPIQADHDEIGEYLRAKDSSHLAAVDRRGPHAVCTLAGEPTAALRLSVFRDVAGGVERRFVPVAPFAGQVELEV